MTAPHPCGCPPYIAACAHSLNPAEPRVAWVVNRVDWLSTGHACHVWGPDEGRFVAVLFVPVRYGDCCECIHVRPGGSTLYVATDTLAEARRIFGDYERKLGEGVLL